MRHLTLITAVLWLAVALPIPQPAAAASEVTVLGGSSTGDYGTDIEVEQQSATLRFTSGDKTQFRAELDLLRINTQLGVVATPLGSIPGRERQGNRNSAGGTGSGAGALDDESGAVEPLTSAIDESSTSGLGDLRLTVSRRLLGGGAKVFRLDGEVGAKVPTADEEKLLGTGQPDYRLGVTGEYRSWSLTTFGGFGWNALGDPEWVELADVFDAYIGIESEPLADRVLVSGWLEGNGEIVAGTGSRTALGVAVRGLHKVRWRAQFMAGLGGSAEDFSAMVGLSFGVSSPTIGTRRIG